jgi:hypothetical protein
MTSISREEQIRFWWNGNKSGPSGFVLDEELLDMKCHAIGMQTENPFLPLGFGLMYEGLPETVVCHFIRKFDGPFLLILLIIHGARNTLTILVPL